MDHINSLIVTEEPKAVVQTPFPTKETSGSDDFTAEYYFFKVQIICNLYTLFQGIGKEEKPYSSFLNLVYS